MTITNKFGTRKVPREFVESFAQTLFCEGTMFGFALSNVIMAVLLDNPDGLRAMCRTKLVEINCGRIVVRNGNLEADITVSEDGTFVKVLEDEDEEWARVVSEFRF